MKALQGAYCLASFLLLVDFASPIQSNWEDFIKKECSKRNSIKISDIIKVENLNKGCAYSCWSNKREQVMSYLREGKNCQDDSGIWQCQYGKCRDSGERYNANGLVEIKVWTVQGKIPPLANPNDKPHVDIVIENNAGISYERGNIICGFNSKHIGSSPVWKYHCKPMPVLLKTELRFNVYESERKRHLLGHTIKSVEFLLKNSHELPLNISYKFCSRSGCGGAARNRNRYEDYEDYKDHTDYYDDDHEDWKGNGGYGRKQDYGATKRHGDDKFWILATVSKRYSDDIPAQWQ